VFKTTKAVLINCFIGTANYGHTCAALILFIYPWKPYCKGRFSTVDLVLTSLDELHFILKILFTYVTKQATLMWRSTVLSLSLQLVFPASVQGILKGEVSLYS